MNNNYQPVPNSPLVDPGSGYQQQYTQSQLVDPPMLPQGNYGGYQQMVQSPHIAQSPSYHPRSIPESPRDVPVMQNYQSPHITNSPRENLFQFPTHPGSVPNSPLLQRDGTNNFQPPTSPLDQPQAVPTSQSAFGGEQINLMPPPNRINSRARNRPYPPPRYSQNNSVFNYDNVYQSHSISIRGNSPHIGPNSPRLAPMSDPNMSPHMTNQLSSMNMNDPNQSPHILMNDPNPSPHIQMNDPNPSPHVHMTSPHMHVQMGDPGTPSHLTMGTSSHIIDPNQSPHIMNDPSPSPHYVRNDPNPSPLIQHPVGDTNYSPHIPQGPQSVIHHREPVQSPHMSHMIDPNQSPHISMNDPNMSPHIYNQMNDPNASPHPGTPYQPGKFTFPPNSQHDQPPPYTQSSTVSSMEQHFSGTSSSGGETMLGGVTYTDNELLQATGTMNVPEVAGTLTELGDQSSQHNFDLFTDESNDQSADLDLFSENGGGFSMGDSSGSGSLQDESLGHSTMGSGPPSTERPRSKGRPSKSGSPGRSVAQCQVCAKQFNNSSALAKHKLTHSDERKYVCMICSKAFKRQDHLNGHMMTHRSKKPYECKFDGCDKSYCDARSLRRHLENHHNATESVSTSTVTATTIIPPMQSPNGPPYFQFEQQGQGEQTLSKLSPGSGTYLDQLSPISPAPSRLGLGPQQAAASLWHSNTDALSSLLNVPKPVECTICHRRFKNIPALNGHMRLHGGYFKKDANPNDKDTDNNNDGSKSASASSEPETPLPPTLEMQDTFSGKSTMSDKGQTSPGVKGRRNSGGQGHSPNDAPPALVLAMNPQVYQPQPTDHVTHSSVGHGYNDLKSAVPSSVTLPSNLSAASSAVGMTLPPAVYGSAFHMSLGPYHAGGGDGAYAGLPLPSTLTEYNTMMAPGVGGSQVLSRLQEPTLYRNNALAALLTKKDHSAIDIEQKLNNNNIIPKTLNLMDNIGPSVHNGCYSNEHERERAGTMHKNSSQDVQGFSFTKADTIKSRDIIRRQNETSVKNEVVANTESPSSQSPTTDLRRRHASADDQVQGHIRKRSLASPHSMNSMLQHLDPMALGKSIGSAQKQLSTCDDDIFVRPRAWSRTDNPSVRSDDHHYHTVSREKGKRKHRPEPLIIPPQVNHFGFASRLRSPRLWEGPESHRGHTPPPYTPPPMLSPVRSGSGLFWMVRPATPKTAPATPRLLPTRRISIIDKAEAFDEDQESDEPPPPTDIRPHVNIGPQYQAVLPDYNPNRTDAYREHDKENMVWCPTVLQDVTDEEVDNYQEFSCCAAIPKNGVNREYALHILYRMQGDIRKAILQLMNRRPMLPKDHHLHTYHYQESDQWNTEDIEAYHQALIKFHKDFYLVAKAISKKTVQQCVQFYYLWKKVCPEEYKRLRILRRKREHEELYNLRSKALKDKDETHHNNQSDSDSAETASTKSEDQNDKEHEPISTAPVFSCDICTAVFNSKQALNGHARIHGGTDNRSKGPTHRPKQPSPKPVSKTILPDGTEEFPCKLCGKVFAKVKSRNAHMKSHRQIEKTSIPKERSYSPYRPEGY